MIKKTISKRRSGKKMEVKKYLIISLFLLLGGLFVAGGQVVVKDGKLNVTEDFLVSNNILYVNSSSGRVGIGTAEPSQLLHLSSSSDAAVLFQSTETVGGGSQSTEYSSPGSLENDTGIGNLGWTDETNASASDNLYAFATPSGSQITNYLNATNFGFNIPTNANITGIEVGIEKRVYDPYTKLLLHADGTDGSTTFTDSSTSAHTVMPLGNVQIDTAQSKFGGTSILSDGTTDGLVIPNHADFAFGTGDFTIDFWVRWSGSATGVILFNNLGSSTGLQLFYYPATGLLYFYLPDVTRTWSWAPSADTWYHIAAVRSGTNVMIFINGAQLGSTQSSSGNIQPTVEADIGINADNSTYSMNGWIDEFRISNIARWTSAFTPPTSPYNNVQDNQVSLVLSNGSIGTTNKSTGSSWSASDETTTYGSSTDTWGETLTPADINNLNFGVVISANATATAYIDQIKMKVYYDTASSDVNWALGSDSDTSGHFKLSYSTALGTSDRLTIDGSGNIGIGTTSPSEKLDVNGNVRADDFIEYSDIYKGDALSVIKSMKTEGTNTGDWQGLDHSSLQNVEGLIQVYNDGNTIVYGRSINKMMDVNTRAIEQLLTKIEYLESELCKKDNTYTWC